MSVIPSVCTLWTLGSCGMRAAVCLTRGRLRRWTGWSVPMPRHFVTSRHPPSFVQVEGLGASSWQSVGGRRWFSERIVGSTTPTVPLITEVNASSFQQAVLDESHRVPVILDCYATWCDPCKKLTPLLESLVRKAGGGVQLAKLNIDDSPELADQMGVRSVPTVFALFQGRVVTTFQGLLDENSLHDLLDKLVALGGGQSSEQRLQQATTALEQDDVSHAAKVFASLLSEDRGSKISARATAGLALCALKDDDIDTAQQLVARLRESYGTELKDPHVAQAISAVELAVDLDVEDSEGDLRQAVQNDPSNQDARYELAKCLFAKGKREQAIEEAIQMIRRDRSWNGEAARLLLLKIFEALGPQHELTLKGRKRFANLWFS